MSSATPSPKNEKQVLSSDQIHFLSKGEQEKYEELVQSPSLLEKEKNKWKAAFEEMEDIYNNTPCGYHSLDEDGVYLKVNQTELDWLGYTREELIRKKRFSELLTESSLLIFVRVFPRFRETGAVQNIEFDMVRKDGTILPVLLNSTALYDDQGNFKMSRTVILNNSERKTMEKELLRINRSLLETRQQLEEKARSLEELSLELHELNEQKDILFYMASDDLRDPLMKVFDLAEQLLSDKGVDRYHPIFRKIQEETTRAKRLIRNVLVQQRLATGDSDIKKSRVNLSGLLVGLGNLLEEQAQRLRVKLICEVFDKVYYKTDEDYLAQVVDNLLSYALTQSPPDKEIYLRLVKQQDGIHIEIEDEGPGYKKEELPALFEKNRYISGSPSGREALSGMELSLAKNLAEKMNWRLSVSSEAGIGTKFTLVLPYRDMYQAYS
ncbi:ATP-binding protein [Paraflavisolibacter sp. H34]|uniref:PAS domain-containing sensor histidine kinase n=1 Tax=Huijunlia imazamoxiresistens TaxID=3127457 RepID=UPI0030188ADC